MVRVSGLIAALLIAAVPCLVLPNWYVLEAGGLAAAVCAGGLLWPSLGLATVGAVLAALVLAVTLLVAAAAHAVVPAVLMGVALLTLLDATHFQLRFAGAAIGAGVVRAHLGWLGIACLISVLVAWVLAVSVELVALGLEMAWRPAVAAGGGILLMLAVLRALTRRAV